MPVMLRIMGVSDGGFLLYFGDGFFELGVEEYLHSGDVLESPCAGDWVAAVSV